MCSGILAVIAAGCGPRVEVQWEAYSQAKMAEAVQAGRPSVLYFSAVWCPSCAELKAKVFTKPEIIRTLEPFARLKADMSFIQSAEVQDLAGRFGVDGVPAVIFFDPSGRETSRIDGYGDAGDFLSAAMTAMLPAPETSAPDPAVPDQS